MNRSSSPENDDGPAHLTEKDKYWMNLKQCVNRLRTYGNVIWSGTVESHDVHSQKRVFDCSIKTLDGIRPFLKQLNICILRDSFMKSLLPHRLQSRGFILCIDENTDMMLFSAFSQAIRLARNMVGCTVLKNTASAVRVLFVQSLSCGHEDYIIGNIKTYQANDSVLGILRCHGLLPYVNPEHKELAKQNAMLEEELRLKDKKLIEQQRLNQKQVKRHKKLIEEKEREHEEERNIMAEQMRDKERTITTLDRKIKDVLHGKEEMVNNLYLEFQCSICQDTMIEAHCLPSCRHTFCKYCIGQWLEEKTKCPLCKHEAGIPVPYIGFDKAIDSVIGHFGKEAKQARIDAVKNREAAIEIIHVRSFLVSSEESEGQSATSERESMTSDGESMISEEESVTSERESVTSEGESMISEEEEMVPEHSCSVTELEASFVGPRESSANRSSEESLIEAAEGEQLHREPEEMQTPSFFSTLPPFLPLSSPSSSEDEPSLS